MQETKRLVKEHLAEAKAREDAQAVDRARAEGRDEQRREWREQQRHLRNTNKGSLLRK